MESAPPQYEWNEQLEAGIPLPNLKNLYEQSFLTRMLYSCLVDADYLDTEVFMSPVVRSEYDPLPELLQRLNTYIKPWFPAKNQINEYRCQILNRCLNAASSPRGIYSLTVPTGGGKTVASLAFALKHAVENGMDRVIYKLFDLVKVRRKPGVVAARAYSDYDVTIQKEDLPDGVTCERMG